MPFPVITVTVAYVSVCMISDVRTRRIPNALSVPAMAIGLALNWFTSGVAGALNSTGGLVLLMAILFPPFALGGVGAGDVKMMGAVGALLGPRLGLVSLIAGMLIGGLVMGVHLVGRSRLREKVAAMATMFGLAIKRGSIEPLRLSDHDPQAIALPYGVPLGFGTLLAVGAFTVWGT